MVRKEKKEILSGSKLLFNARNFVKCLSTKVQIKDFSWTLRWFYMGLIAHWRAVCRVWLEVPKWKCREVLVRVDRLAEGICFVVVH